jgi:hypothetical protein
VLMKVMSGQRYLERANRGRVPALSELIAQLDEAEEMASRDCQPSVPLSVMRFEPAFARLMQSRELEIILAEMLGELSVEEYYRRDYISPRLEEWFIASSRLYSLEALVIRPSTNPTFSTFSQDCIIGNLGGAPIEFLQHRLSAIRDLGAFETGLQLPQGEPGAIQSRQCAVFRCGLDAIELALSAPAIQVQLLCGQHAPLVWRFTRSDRRAQLATAATDSATRSQIVGEFLQHLANESLETIGASIGYLETLVQSPHHFVRWRALQSLCAIDFQHAKPLLLQALHDPHPAVAEAAGRAVDRLGRAK